MTRKNQQLILSDFAATGLAVALGCAPTSKVPCKMETGPEARSGYEILWTPREAFDVFARICTHQDPSTYSLIHFEIALIHGTGDAYMGAKLWSELAPRLAEFKIDGWSLSCGGRVYAITINNKQEHCHVDRIIEAIGQYLKQRNASDFVVLQMGLWAAPAAGVK